MRKILKALSLVMVLVMCFTMVFTTAVSAEGATPMLTINSAAVKEGETVTITVDAANFGAVAGAHFVVALPAELENVAVAESDFVAYDAEAGTVTFVKEANWTDGKCDGIADGALVTITATAAVGTYVVDFAETGKTVDFCDANYATIDVTKVAGEVVVETAVVEPQEPIYEETLALKSAAIVFDADLIINYYVLNTVVAQYDSMYLHCVKVDGTTRDLPLESTSSQPDRMPFKYTGVAAKEVNDSMTATIYATKDGVEYVGKTITYSVATYCNNQLKSSSAKAGLKKVCADLLNYGTEAQKYFTYNLDNLANEKLGTEPYSDAVLQAIADYQTSGDAPLGNKTVVVGDKSTTLDVKSGSLIFLSKVTIKLYFTINTSVVDLNDVTVKIRYVDEIKGEQEILVKGSELGFDSTNTYYYEFAELAAKDLRTLIYVDVFNGETPSGRSLTYSAESYAYSQQSKAAAAVSMAMMKYSDALDAYL